MNDLPFARLGKSVVQFARISMPYRGRWVADVSVLSDSGTPPANGSATTLYIGDTSWVGTVMVTGEFAGQTRCRVVGGLGLSTVLLAKSYSGLSAIDVVRDTLREAKVELDPASAATMTGPSYVRMAGPAYDVVDAIASTNGSAWRVLANGRVWIGVDRWKTPRLPDQQGLGRGAQPEMRIWEYHTTEPWLLPGMTWDGHRIGSVEYHTGGVTMLTEYA